MTAFPIPLEPFADLHPDLRDAHAKTIAEVTPQDAPYLIHMMGTVGVGKTTFAHLFLKQLNARSPFLLDFDRVMETIEDYRAMPNRQEAFKLYELPARAAGYYLFHDLLQARGDILFDHSAANVNHVALLQYAKNQSYKIIIANISAPIGTAQKRITQRQGIQQRYTPPHYVEERYKLLQELRPAYQAIADHWLDLDNSKDYPALNEVNVISAVVNNDVF